MFSFGPRRKHPRKAVAAVEVTAIFGESVVARRQLLLSPRRAQTQKRTRLLFAVAALLFLSSGVAFWQGVELAAHNQEKYRAHLGQQGTAHEFRPERLGAGWEWLGLGGAAFGLVLLTLAISRRHEGNGEAAFRVGDTPGSDYPLPTAKVDSFDLVSACRDEGFVLQVPEGWRAQIFSGAGALSLSEARSGLRQSKLPNDFEAHLQSGDHRFLLRSATAARKQTMPLVDQVDSRFLAFLCGTTIVVVALMLLLESHFEVEKRLYSDLFAATPRITDIRFPAKEKKLLRPSFAAGQVAGQVGGTGEAMLGLEGAMGKKTSQPSQGRYTIKKREATPQLARGRAMAEAREAGLLGVLSRQPSFATLVASDTFTSGNDEADVYGGLVGNQVGEMSGAWGYGITGVGEAGGGTGWGTIGTGNYGLLGHGSGTGSGWGAGGGIGVSGRDSGPPGVRIGNASLVGDLDKNIIRRYIRRKLPRITYCYEKALLGEPDLEGSVETHFRISPIGEVQNASASGIEEEEMHECIASALASIQFPKPKGGGYVMVHYPFTFSPSGH